jgi:hypothetical protein
MQSERDVALATFGQDEWWSASEVVSPWRQGTCPRELLTLSASANLGLWLLHAAHCSDVMVRETSLRRRSVMIDAWLLPATV